MTSTVILDEISSDSHLHNPKIIWPETDGDGEDDVRMTIKDQMEHDVIVMSSKNMTDSMILNGGDEIDLEPSERDVNEQQGVKDQHEEEDGDDVQGGLRMKKDSVSSCEDFDGDVHYFDSVDDSESIFSSRLQQMEEEQEQLNNSLIALTSHFAQVQLRLKQIVSAENEEKEQLLKELEEFAFRGIPDLRQPQIDFDTEIKDSSSSQHILDPDERESEVRKLEAQRIKQKELISKLKDQLEDLEKYAYETGEMSCIPSSMLLERQSVIIEQLKGRLPLNLDEMDKLSPEDLRRQVDQALRDLINPVIMKEQLVDQLKTQVTDLERFIRHLQMNEGGKCGKKGSEGKCTCSCPLHGNSQTALETYNESKAADRKRKNQNTKSGVKYGDTVENEEAIKMIKRVMTLLQMITFAQFGCNRNQKKFERNILKKTTKGNHWGDLRARLEVAVEHLLEINKEKFCNDSDYTSDSDDNIFSHGNEKMTCAVRKELSVALRDLLEHGLIDFTRNPSSGSSLIVSHILDWGCFSARSSQVPTDTLNRKMTAWDLLLKYYEIKNGDGFGSTPARRLSQSFNLHIVGGVAVTPKQTLLTAISDIVETHTPLKRSPDSHFKAFISRALNEGKLLTWIKLIVKNRTIVESFYEPWGYVASTGFEDAFKSLERLNGVRFDLPIDLAIRQLKSITEAF